MAREKKYKCQVCTYAFENPSGLERHIMHQHSNTFQMHECNVCGKLLKWKTSLNSHLKVHLFVKAKHKCEICPSVSFENASGLKKHNIVMHSGKVQKHECHHCGKVIKRKRDLTVHMRIHLTDTKEFKCDLCGKEFLERKNLNTHTISFCSKIAIKTKFDCEVCHRTYSSKTSFNYHKKHHSIDPTKCTYCDYECKYAAGLARHIKGVHLKENIKCEHCSAEFNENRKLKAHQRQTHFKITEFRCHLCYKVFNSNILRSHHIRTVHEPPKYECHKCRKKFTQLHNMKKHKCRGYWLMSL